ncbi:MAG TPA: RNA polymerase sigma factor [Anaeromyxobacter sp.]|nr:RNA polymerase sigma factor [Anaeromyxobacter sp.]
MPPPSPNPGGPPDARRARDTDEDLVRRAGLGARDAFEALVARHGDALFGFARRTCGPGADAEDALQDGLLAAWRGAATFRGEASARTWLFQVVLHACRRRGRLRAGQPRAHEPLDRAEAVPSPASGADARASARETGAALERAMAALSPEAAEVLMLRDVSGLSGEETAAALGIGVAAMKSRLHRARLELKERVEAILGHAVEEVAA